MGTKQQQLAGTGAAQCQESAPAITTDAQIQIAVFALCSSHVQLSARRYGACVVLAACSQRDRNEQSGSAVLNKVNNYVMSEPTWAHIGGHPLLPVAGDGVAAAASAGTAEHELPAAEVDAAMRASLQSATLARHMPLWLSTVITCQRFHLARLPATLLQGWRGCPGVT